jgi:hypothetical protein
MACFDSWCNVVQETRREVQASELQQKAAPGPAGTRTTTELEANIKFLEVLVDELFQALGSATPSEGVPPRLSPMHR